MSKVIAICDQKGGVGKTMTTINLGIGMARQGKRVLLADVDAQGSLTASLGYQHPDQLEETLATVLGKVIEDKPLSPGEGILHQEEGIDLLPANIDLSSMGRLYKYPYIEQVFIYAQRPEATACASYDMWNKRMGRVVRRGCKGIALPDAGENSRGLRYVFDIDDTVSRDGSRRPYVWEYLDEHEEPVTHDDYIPNLFELAGSAIFQADQPTGKPSVIRP